MYRHRRSSVGVLLLHYRTATSADLLTLFGAHWSEIEGRLPGHFVVASMSRLRIRPLD